jgi:hypothetical protein
MISRRITFWKLVACLMLSAASLPVAHAQTSGDQTAPAANASTKEALKAQRKADRKANRAKRNADLSQLEKNGFNPGRDQIDYPQNFQNAEQKVNAQRQGAKPASAP